MYRKIAFSKKISKKEKIKNLLAYYLRRRGARIIWDEKWGRFRRLHPDYMPPADPQAEREHQQYWKPFRKKLKMQTFRNSVNISGVVNPRIIPEEVFMTDIEPTLNGTSSVVYLSYKSFYNHWFQADVFPYDYIHNIDGALMDHELNPVSGEKLQAIVKEIKYPVVLKPNRDSYGGKNVYFPENSEELIQLMEERNNFLVQEKLTQHPFFSAFNPHGINSIRVNIYRSVSDNQLHVVNIAFRMGVGGSLDNLTSGGIGTMIREDGRMDGYALDVSGGKFPEHPDTGISFDKQIPEFEELKRTALEVAGKILYARIICLDLCLDVNGKWRMIEVNINGTTLTFAHYHGVPFFGPFTDEVREYCVKNHWTLKH